MNFLKLDYVRYGLIMNGVIIICLAAMEFTGQNKTFEKSPFAFFFMMVAPVIIWYLGISARKRLQKGKLTFKQGLSEGFKMALVYGITSPFIFLIYYTIVNPGMIDYAREVYRMPSAASNIIIATDMTVQFIFSIVGGTVLSAVISFFLKSKKK